MTKATVTRQLGASAYRAGNPKTTFRVLYRVDIDEQGNRLPGEPHQYPPVPVEQPGRTNRILTRASDKQLADAIEENPGSEFFQVEITI